MYSGKQTNLTLVMERHLQPVLVKVRMRLVASVHVKNIVRNFTSQNSVM